MLLGASLGAQLVKNLLAIQETLVRFLGQENPLEKGWVIINSSSQQTFSVARASLVAQMVKNPPATQETQV